ncbi:MAG TPA: ABC transporter permease [Allosphingosinicella sp.]|jgi:putative ABC transport system permease protein|nr:ABC transporter permease [Allosphingosinicella sp.]
MTTLWLAWRNLMRHRLRAALMLFSVSIAFVLYGTLFGLNTLLGGGDIAGGRDLIVHHRANILQTLPAHYRDSIVQVPGIESIAAVSIIGGYVGERANKVPTLMVDPEPYLAQNGDGIVLPADQRADFLASRDAVIVDAQTAEANRWSVGDRIVVTSEISPHVDGGFDWPFRIAGIYTAAKPEDAITGAFGRIDYFNAAAAVGRDRVHWFSVRTRDASANDRIAGTVDTRFANSEAETRTEPAAAMARAFLTQVVDFTLVIRLVVGAAFATILMIVGNTVALGVRQRRREFGVMRALGFGARQVAAVVVAESLIVAVVGALLGLALSSLLLALMSAGITGAAPTLSSLPLGVLASGLGIAALFGTATALLPTYRAARISPAEAFSRS